MLGCIGESGTTSNGTEASGGWARHQDESLRENRTVDRAQGMSVLKKRAGGGRKRSRRAVSWELREGGFKKRAVSSAPTCTSQQQRAVLPACWQGFTCTYTLVCSHFFPLPSLIQSTVNRICSILYFGACTLV